MKNLTWKKEHNGDILKILKAFKEKAPKEIKESMKKLEVINKELYEILKKMYYFEGQKEKKEIREKYFELFEKKCDLEDKIYKNNNIIRDLKL